MSQNILNQLNEGFQHIIKEASNVNFDLPPLHLTDYTKFKIPNATMSIITKIALDWDKVRNEIPERALSITAEGIDKAPKLTFNFATKFLNQPNVKQFIHKWNFVRLDKINETEILKTVKDPYTFFDNEHFGIFKNPSRQEYTKLYNRYQYLAANTGETIVVRFIFDIDNNLYLWMNEKMHKDMEPLLNVESAYEGYFKWIDSIKDLEVHGLLRIRSKFVIPKFENVLKTEYKSNVTIKPLNYI